jgi:lysophospholipase L1-like esterase
VIVALALVASACGGRDRPADPDAPRSMAALGDSITRAFAACDGGGDCPDASWATGRDGEVRSHAQRLDDLAGRTPTVHNVAVSGSRVSDLESQARRAVDAKVDYVTVLIGANDACAPSESAMTPVSAFATAFDRAMATLAAGLPDARVLVVSIPDLSRLWEVGKDDASVRETWERFGICQSMLADPTATDPAAEADGPGYASASPSTTA